MVETESPSTRLLGWTILGLILVYACWIHLPDLDHPYLPGWDEAVHAGVAANLSEHPCVPTLFARPFLPLDSRNWQACQVWLHLPPLPFWQAALSIAIGGRSLWALRLPSLLLLLASLVLLARLGRRLYGEAAGLLAALLLASSPFSWLLVQGYHFGDLSDVSLAFWLLATVGCLERTLVSGRVGWALAAGVCQGAALLSKSALALAPAGACVLLWLLPRLRLRLDRRPAWVLPACVLGPALMCWGAWRLYSAWRWPEIEALERAALWAHVTTSYEGHGRPWDALFNDLLGNLFGRPLCLLLLAAAVWSALDAWRRRSSTRALVPLWIFGTWLPLVLVQTKVPAVLFGMAPALALAWGATATAWMQAPRKTWALALAVTPLSTLWMADWLPVGWLTWAGAVVPDMAARPDLPLQFLVAVVCGLALVALGLISRRFAPAGWLPWAQRAARVTVGLLLVLAASLPLLANARTRSGIAILRDYNPVANASQRLLALAESPAAVVIEGVTNGRQRPELALAFWTGASAHLVSGGALERASGAAQQLGPAVLLSPIWRGPGGLFAPEPGCGFWAYRLEGPVPPPALEAGPEPLARFERGPELVRLALGRDHLPTGSPLLVLALWRAHGPAPGFDTAVRLVPQAGGDAILPFPMPEDFPVEVSAQHLHNLAPAGLLWGTRPPGTGLGEPGRWQDGQLVADDFQVWIPHHVHPGHYRLVIEARWQGRPVPPLNPPTWPELVVDP